MGIMDYFNSLMGNNSSNGSAQTYPYQMQDPLPPIQGITAGLLQPNPQDQQPQQSGGGILDNLHFNPTANSMGLINMGAQMLANSGPSQHPQNALQSLGAGMGGFLQGHEQHDLMDIRKQTVENNAFQQAQQAQYRQLLAKKQQQDQLTNQHKGLVDLATDIKTKAQAQGIVDPEKLDILSHQIQDSQRPYLSSLGIADGQYIPNINNIADMTPQETQAITTQNKVREQSALAPGLAQQHQTNSNIDLTNAIAKDEAINKNTNAQVTDEAINNAAARYNIDGTLPAMGMGKEAAAGRSAILNRAAELATGTSGADQRMGQIDNKANSGALNQLQKQQSMVSSFERTFTKNADLATNLSNKLDRSGVPIFNTWKQAGQKAVTGNADLSAFHAATETVINEYAKISSGSMGNTAVSDAARKQAQSILNTAQTPEQYIAVLSLLRQETQNRMSSFDAEKEALRKSFKNTGKPDAIEATSPQVPTTPQDNGANDPAYQAYLRGK